MPVGVIMHTGDVLRLNGRVRSNVGSTLSISGSLDAGRRQRDLDGSESGRPGRRQHVIRSATVSRHYPRDGR